MTSKNTAQMDNDAIENKGRTSVELVYAAARKLYERICSIEASLNKVFDHIVILCGSGKNGSDGYALGKYLSEDPREVKIIPVFPPKSSESKIIIDDYSKRINCGILNTDETERYISKADLIVDCIFGTGYDPNRRIDSEFSNICDKVSRSRAYVLSADIPSGVSSDTGEIAYDPNGNAICIKADAVSTFMHSKAGMEVTPGNLYCDKIFTETIDELVDSDSVCEYNTFIIDESVFDFLPKRSIDSNKGTYGQLLCLCGSPDMPGAAMISISAALRTGAGLVRACGSKDTLNILKSRISEPIFTTLPATNGRYDIEAFEILKGAASKATAILCGCGVGIEKSVKDIFTALLTEYDLPVIIDADMLNLLCQDKEFFSKHGKNAIITPHPGEASRLLGVDVMTVNSSRIYYARKLAKDFNCVAVLKGYRTVIADQDGNVYINTTGNNGMSKGGSGDVLAGIIASLASQGVDNLHSAILGTYLHGAAGDLAMDRFGARSMLPSDMVDSISEILKRY